MRPPTNERGNPTVAIEVDYGPCDKSPTQKHEFGIMNDGALYRCKHCGTAYHIVAHSRMLQLAVALKAARFNRDQFELQLTQAISQIERLKGGEKR